MSILRTRRTRMVGLVVTATSVTAGLVTVAPAHALTGSEAPSGQYASVVKLSVGDETNNRACTATLVDEWWVATAASCFATVAGQQVPAGKPALQATVTLANGETREVTEIAPRAERDLALARLVLPARGAATVKVSASAPVTATGLSSAGFGRTKTEWVPGKLHTGTFTLDSATDTTLAITGKGTDAICKGDTGGPLLNAAGELVGVNSRSWQAGCLGTDPAETRTGAIAARTDDLAQWISKTTEPRRSAAANEAGGADQVRWADWNGDGKPDFISIAANGNVSVWLNSGPNAWQGIGRVATGTTTDRSRVRLADFDGDGRADYWVINPNGSVNVHINRGGDVGGGWQNLGTVASGVTTKQDQVRFADWDGDGRSDFLTIADNGNVSVWLNRGPNAWQGIGRVATGTTTDRSRVRLADWNGDGKADYWVINPNGSVDVHTNMGGDVGGGWSNVGQVASGVTTEHNRVHFADFNGDAHTDFLLRGSGNSTAYSAWLGNGRVGGWNGLGQIASGV
ncbi:FG-GAP-like repeat-containing protein [Streptomyces sp. NPDC007369]|uniref:FG-GAP-like repeat-containing protein n=1 Tax=Streptomyces sp. NPDC007369 TaxID=3154589 RepID=UPI0033E93865